MNHYMRCLLILISSYLPLVNIYASETHWSYQGNHGPKHWGEFGSALCAGGTQQSPINIEMIQVQTQKSMSSDLTINYKKSALTVTNNSHTIQANIKEGNTVRYQGHEYKLIQLHFHTPSEHQINNSSYPMEMHLVHQDLSGRLLVLAVMIKEGGKNIELAPLWSKLPSTTAKEINLSAERAPNLENLIPTTSHHLYYKGSLTTPPCTEGVQWILFEQPIEMSKSQIHKFRELFPKNYRPLQPLNKREVDED